MKKWSLTFAIAGYSAAALYYFTSYFDIASVLCPVCANVDAIKLTPLQRDLRFTAVFGTVNTLLFEAVGFVIIGSARYFRHHE